MPHNTRSSGLRAVRIALVAPVLAALAAGMGGAACGRGSQVRRVRSADGVEIAYTARGAGSPALVFIHGGLADRTFWEPQLEQLSAEFRVVALDLAGHGESGRNRPHWRIAAFAEDVRAVVDAEKLDRMVLVGNSMGGPVALEAAPLLRGRVIGVIGVDTFQNVTIRPDPSFWHARAAAFRKDFAGSCAEMAKALFHPDADATLRASVEKRLCGADPTVAADLLDAFATYDQAQAARAAGVPIRAIVGDLFAVNLAADRSVVPDFDAVVMRDAGHFPMLERPAEFDRILVAMVHELAARPAAQR